MTQDKKGDAYGGSSMAEALLRSISQEDYEYKAYKGYKGGDDEYYYRQHQYKRPDPQHDYDYYYKPPTPPSSPPSPPASPPSPPYEYKYDYKYDGSYKYYDPYSPPSPPPSPPKVRVSQPKAPVVPRAQLTQGPQLHSCSLQLH